MKEELFHNQENQRTIKTVAIVGLGALGILYGHHLSKHMPKENLRIIADQSRIDRYRRDKVYCNREACDFQYVTPDQSCEPADLVIFAVKYYGLKDAIHAVRNQVGAHTILISALNGISSEEMIGEAYGMDQILYCVAQGMDAVKEGNRLTYEHMGILVIGEKEAGHSSTKLESLKTFFDKAALPYEVDLDMKKRLWGKFMLNVGVNQTVAVMEGDYDIIQKEGLPRSIMISAMKEVISLAQAEKISLGEEDIAYWLSVLSTLNPKGKPSMRQDMEAGRYSEVELFAGTVLRLAHKHQIPAPVNQELYDKILEMERNYGTD